MSLGIVAAVLVLVAGFLYRRRLSGMGRGTRLDDDLIRRIEEEGRIELDDPLDLERIRKEEEQFFEETWDEPEEF